MLLEQLPNQILRARLGDLKKSKVEVEVSKEKEVCVVGERGVRDGRKGWERGSC